MERKLIRAGLGPAYHPHIRALNGAKVRRAPFEARGQSEMPQ